MSLLTEGPVRVVVAGVEFDNGTYDAETDTAYYFRGSHPGEAAYSVETPEGHVLRYSADDELIGMTLLCAQAIRKANGGQIIVTVP